MTSFDWQVAPSETYHHKDFLTDCCLYVRGVRIRTISGFSIAELTHIIEDTYYDTLVTLCTSSPEADLRKEPDMVLFSTGIPNNLLNSVLGPRFTSKNMARRAEEALSYFKEKRLPTRFLIGPSSTPPELGTHLQRQGLVPGWSIPGMLIDLKAVDRRPLPADLVIQQVKDLKTLRVCVDALGKGFEVEGKHVDKFSDLIMGFGFSSTRRWFLGRVNGEAVATSLLIPHKGFAGIYCVGTVPEARRRGIGTAITREALLVAKETGYEYAILEASKMGLPVYDKLGFKECCKIRTYTWSPD